MLISRIFEPTGWALGRDVGVCVPFPVKQIKANNVIDNIIQNIDNIHDMMK